MFRPDNPILIFLIGCIPFTVFIGGLWLYQRHMIAHGLLILPGSVMSRSESAVTTSPATDDDPPLSTQGTGNREPGTTEAEPGTGDLKLDIKRHAAIVEVIKELDSGKKLTGDRLRVLLGVRKDFALDLLNQARVEPEEEPLQRLDPQPGIVVPEQEPVPL